MQGLLAPDFVSAVDYVTLTLNYQQVQFILLYYYDDVSYTIHLLFRTSCTLQDYVINTKFHALIRSVTKML
jgi:hypothetical protein